MHNFQNKVENISVELSHMSSCDIMITDRWNYRHAAHVFFGHKWQFYKSIKRSPNKLLTGLKLTEMSFCAPTSHFVVFFWLIFIFTEYISHSKNVLNYIHIHWIYTQVSTNIFRSSAPMIFYYCLGWGKSCRFHLLPGMGKAISDFIIRVQAILNYLPGMV